MKRALSLIGSKRKFRRFIHKSFAALSLVAFLFLIGVRAEASEGGSSHYLPGTVGDALIAQVPAPGLAVSNTVFVQSGDLGIALLGGELDFNLDLDLVLNLVSVIYPFETPFLGGRYSLGAAIPFGYLDINAELHLPGIGAIDDSDTSFDISDVAFIPLQLNWNFGAFSFKFAEVIIAPTGGYDVNETANLGTNYWSFDTAVAVTWFNTETNTEVSIAPGIQVNTENDDTHYKTGKEFHVDFTVNQFLSETFSIGLKGYYYRQITGDSGSGATLGDFKSESLGFGPGFLWIPEFGGGNLTILTKWMHDVTADNRFESDYGTFTIAYKF
ncbi:MAG: transporter [Desulfobacterales bacterium]|nr:transporter [Desulfobacterales bacterium]